MNMNDEFKRLISILSKYAPYKFYVLPLRTHFQSQLGTIMGIELEPKSKTPIHIYQGSSNISINDLEDDILESLVQYLNDLSLDKIELKRLKEYKKLFRKWQKGVLSWKEEIEFKKFQMDDDYNKIADDNKDSFKKTFYTAYEDMKLCNSKEDYMDFMTENFRLSIEAINMPHEDMIQFLIKRKEEGFRLDNMKLNMIEKYKRENRIKAIKTIYEQAKSEVHASGNQSLESMALRAIEISQKNMFYYLYREANKWENRDKSASEFFEDMERIIDFGD